MSEIDTHDDIEKQCELVKSNGTSLIYLRGAIKVLQVTLLKSLLIECINEQEPIRIDMTAVSDLDVTSIQLLFSAKNKAAQQNVEFNIFPVSEEGKEVLRCAGVLHDFFSAALEQ